jgi:CHASE2 domain-containing sensor protein
MPMRTPVMHIASARNAYSLLGGLLYVLGALGGLLAWRRDRRLTLLMTLPLLLTTGLYLYAHAFPIERYLAPALPPFLVLAGLALASAIRRVLRINATRSSAATSAAD